MNIFITGSSRGIGEGITLHYLKAGHDVFAINRSSNEKLNAYPNFHFRSVDLSRLETIKSEIQQLLSENTPIELAILNAGMLNEIKDLTHTSIDEINSVMDVNVWANKHLIEALISLSPGIKQIIAISSGASVSGARGWNAYSLSKATLNMLINLYSKEYPRIHFCALAPGIIDTAMQDYIYSLNDDKKYPVVQKLKKLKGTESMPDPVKASKILIQAFDTIKSFESGRFLDVRDL